MKAIGLVLVAVGALLETERVTGQPPPAGLVRDVASGAFVLVARADGSVVAWGQAPGGSLAVPTVVALPGPALRVAAGESSGYALLEDGTVVAWGSNDEGQLGNGALGASRALGTYPKPSVTPVKVTGLVDVIAVEAGRKHAVALREDGTVLAWGTRDDGALGGGDVKPPGSLRVLSALAPVPVPGLEGITQIAAGPTHTLALRRDGHVMSWGSNSDGELGIGTRFTGWTPAEVQGLDRVLAIAAGSGAGKGVSGAVRDDGTVWMWGSNTSAQMGNGQGPLSPDDPGGRILLPLPVKGVASAKSLAIGGGHAAALLGDGSLRMWGHDGYGQIGVGTSGFYQEKPVKVSALANVAAVYLGSMRSYAVRADGTFWIWGFGHSPAQGVLLKHLHVPTLLALP